MRDICIVKDSNQVSIYRATAKEVSPGRSIVHSTGWWHNKFREKTGLDAFTFVLISQHIVVEIGRNCGPEESLDNETQLVVGGYLRDRHSQIGSGTFDYLIALGEQMCESSALASVKRKFMARAYSGQLHLITTGLSPRVSLRNPS